MPSPPTAVWSPAGDADSRPARCQRGRQGLASRTAHADRLEIRAQTVFPAGALAA